MKTFEVLVLNEDDLGTNEHIKQSLGGDKVMWMATQVVLVKSDGTTKVLKDRWAHPNNPPKATLSFPSGH